jgi:hypothetical protein
VRCIFALFRQTERYNAFVSIGTEKKELLRFSGMGRDSGKAKGARIGLIYPQGPGPLIPGVPDKGELRGRISHPFLQYFHKAPSSNKSNNQKKEESPNSVQ